MRGNLAGFTMECGYFRRTAATVPPGLPGAVCGKAATANLRNLDSECEHGAANGGGRFLREMREFPRERSVVGSRCPEVTIGSNENCLGYPEKDQRP